MSTTRWTTEKIGDQDGRVAIVTGSNSGIGLEEARALAKAGATVIVAVRNSSKGEQAVEEILKDEPEGSVEVMLLDLASLDSVREFSGAFHERFNRLDILINNAGVMMPPKSTTADGFELQFGTNHLGHFALTGLLMDLLLKTEGSRIVNVSSMAHRWGEIDFDDLQWESRAYKRAPAYGQSKLANLLFTYELQRRLQAADADTIAVASHPGWTATNLQRNAGFFELLNPILAMKPWQGALPTIFAAVDGGAGGGEYYGPSGFYEMRGYPKRVDSNDASKDAGVARRLWEVSEELTGVTFAPLTAPAATA